MGAAPQAIEILPETDTTTFSIPDRLTIQNVAKRRAAAGRLVAGVAAVADFELFKGKTQHLHKQVAKRWDRKCDSFSFSFVVGAKSWRRWLIILAIYRSVNDRIKNSTG